MADVEENVANQPKEDTEKHDETTEETNEGDIEEKTENLNSNTEDIDKNKPDSESGPPKSSSYATANVSNRSKEMDSSSYPSPPQIVFDLRLGKQCNLRDLWQCNRIVENWAETRITTSKRMLHGERELQDSVQSTNSSETG